MTPSRAARVLSRRRRGQFDETNECPWEIPHPLGLASVRAMRRPPSAAPVGPIPPGPKASWLAPRAAPTPARRAAVAPHVVLRRASGHRV